MLCDTIVISMDKMADLSKTFEKSCEDFQESCMISIELDMNFQEIDMIFALLSLKIAFLI
jgi:hypothetical protein